MKLQSTRSDRDTKGYAETMEKAVIGSENAVTTKEDRLAKVVEEQSSEWAYRGDERTNGRREMELEGDRRHESRKRVLIIR